MKILKNYSLLCLKFIIFLLIGSLINSIFYFYLFSKNTVNIISIIYLSLVIFNFSYKMGRKANSKGLIVGLKLGLLFVLNLSLINIILNGFKFNLIQILYYLILISISIIASIIGINKKK